MTAKEAIALGNIHAVPDEERIIAAGTRAGVDTMVRTWQNGWEQLVGRGFTDGIELSAGQYQRLALARLFYREPAIMLLDEPTSWVDVPTESKLFRELKELPSDRSLIFISHRFSTVRQADEIILLENGEIAAQGSHEELLTRSASYTARYQEEAQYYQPLVGG